MRTSVTDVAVVEKEDPFPAFLGSGSKMTA
jgi:hypothetical protein